MSLLLHLDEDDHVAYFETPFESKRIWNLDRAGVVHTGAALAPIRSAALEWHLGVAGVTAATLEAQGRRVATLAALLEWLKGPIPMALDAHLEAGTRRAVEPPLPLDLGRDLIREGDQPLSILAARTPAPEVVVMAYGSRRVALSLPIETAASPLGVAIVPVESSLLRLPLAELTIETVVRIVREDLPIWVQSSHALATALALPMHISGRLEPTAAVVLEGFTTAAQMAAAVLLVAGRFGTAVAPWVDVGGYTASPRAVPLEGAGYLSPTPPLWLGASAYRARAVPVPLSPQAGRSPAAPVLLGTGGEVRQSPRVNLSTIGELAVTRAAPLETTSTLLAPLPTIILEALAGVTRALAAPLSVLAIRAPSAPLPLDLARRLETVAAAVLGTLRTVAPFAVVALEAARTLRPDAAPALEAAGRRVVDVLVPGEGMGRIAAAASPGLESGASLARALSALLETCRGVIATSGQVPIEDVGGTVRVYAALPFNTGRDLVLVRDLAIEALRRLPVLAAAGIEAIGGLTPSPPVWTEVAGATGADRVAELEAAGRLLVTTAAPLETALRLLPPLPAPVDVQGRRVVAALSLLEALRGLRRTAPDLPLAPLRGVEAAPEVRLENLSLGINSFLHALLESWGHREVDIPVIVGVSSVQKLIHLATLTGEVAAVAAQLVGELARVASPAVAQTGATLADERASAGSLTESSVGRPGASETVKP